MAYSLLATRQGAADGPDPVLDARLVSIARAWSHAARAYAADFRSALERRRGALARGVGCAGTLKQLASGAGLREQFANRDRLLGRASAALCLLGAAGWAAVTTPGLAGKHQAVLAVVVTAGITVAVCRTVSRPPLDYSKPPVPTPFGDLRLDLWRQLLRGPLLRATLILIVLLVR